MKTGTTTHHVCVTIEWPDGRVEFKWWSGGSVRRIHTKARLEYVGADIQFGRAIGTNSYGAH